MKNLTTKYGHRKPLHNALEVFDILPEGTRAEVLNNILYMPTSPTVEHQELSVVISSQIHTHTKQSNLGKTVCWVDTYLDDNNAVQPDILFISNENLDIIQDGKVRGVPDLIIEILSPGNRKYDLKLKKDRYEAAGVKEYFAIDQKTKEVFGFMLEGKKYVSQDIVKESIVSKVLGTAIKF